MSAVVQPRAAAGSAASSAPRSRACSCARSSTSARSGARATFSSTVEPTIYLLAFGFGFGSLVSTVAGYDYVEFVGTGTVATAVLFSSRRSPAMFGTFVKYQFQRTYDAILAAPVDTEELVTAEALWIAHARRRLRLRPAARGDASSGSTPRWGMLLVPFIALHHRLRLGVLRDRRSPRVAEVDRQLLLRDQHG